MIGRSLGPYRIEARLGEGGMGVVYRATDTQLDRTVAVKVLHPDRVADPERRRRFIHEAKAASALNHPNIITIHQIGSEDGIDYIAMEYVEGQTLDRVIPLRRGLRLPDAVKYAVQIADALAKAHAAGIVHRDLKPANIMVTADGLVKVLDFGLAKLTEPETADSAAPTRTLTSPDAPLTQEGSIVGTVAYMSPEQAEGRRIDARSDIFSFGSVLFEMMTGRPAFHGGSKLSTLSAILHQEPEFQTLETAPQELRRTISRCLRKDPDRRFQHIADVRIALLDVKEESESATARPAPPRRRIPWQSYAAGLALLAAVAGIGWWLLRSPPAPDLRLTQLTFDSGLTTDPALSPDGKLVAYASDRAGDAGLDVWVQQIATGQAIRLTRHPADEREPAFSPDGSRVAFRSERDGGGIWVVSALGGEEKLLAPQGRHPRFSPDGARIAYWAGNIGGDPTVPGTSRMYTVSASGGAPAPLQPDFAAARYPVWSPDGRRILFWGIHGDTHDWWIAPAAGGSAVATGALAALGARELDPPPGAYRLFPSAWLPGDRILFSARSGDSVNLWLLPLASRNPVRLTAGSSEEVQPSAGSGDLLAFAAVRQNMDVWKLPVDHRSARPTGAPQRVTSSAGTDGAPAVAADGSRVVFASQRSGSAQVLIQDLATGKETSLASVPELETWGAISADGSRVAYRVTENNQHNLYLISTARGVPQKICEGCTGAWSFAPDGRQLLVWPGDRTIAVLDLATRRRTTILSRPGYAPFRSRLSLDGRWMTFHARNQPGRSAIYVAPFRGPSPIPEEAWIPVTENDAYDLSPSWSTDGNLLYFLSERDGFRCIWARRLDPASKRPRGEVIPVQHFHAATLSMLPSTTNILGLSAARNLLVFSLVESTGNIWLGRQRALPGAVQVPARSW